MRIRPTRGRTARLPQNATKDEMALSSSSHPNCPKGKVAFASAPSASSAAVLGTCRLGVHQLEGYRPKRHSSVRRHGGAMLIVPFELPAWLACGLGSVELSWRLSWPDSRLRAFSWLSPR